MSESRYVKINFTNKDLQIDGNQKYTQEDLGPAGGLKRLAHWWRGNYPLVMMVAAVVGAIIFSPLALVVGGPVGGGILYGVAICLFGYGAKSIMRDNALKQAAKKFQDDNTHSTEKSESTTTLYIIKNANGAVVDITPQKPEGMESKIKDGQEKFVDGEKAVLKFMKAESQRQFSKWWAKPIDKKVEDVIWTGTAN